jgi:hypothetical protein
LKRGVEKEATAVEKRNRPEQPKAGTKHRRREKMQEDNLNRKKKMPSKVVERKAREETQ